MARWGRAVRLLKLGNGSRVLDLGCAFGYGTRLVAARWKAYGHDLNLQYIDRAKRMVPAAVFTHGSADRVPYPENYFDAVLLLDVLEHVPDEAAVIREVARVLRPGGQLVLSVPHRGAAAGLDSLNLYHRLVGSWAPPPTDDPSWNSSMIHRHYTVAEIMSMLGPRFRIESVHYTGLGVAEIINLGLLLALRAYLHLPRLYSVLQYIYFGMYIAEDAIPAGTWGYHMMLKAERV